MEAKNWHPHSWKKAIVRRRLCNARRQVYRIALAVESPEEVAGIGEAILEICGAEMALEATENERIGATVRSISEKLKTTALVTIPAERNDVHFATA